jgi:hypothetical protein
MESWRRSALIAAANSIIGDRRAPIDARLSALAAWLRLVADEGAPDSCPSEGQTMDDRKTLLFQTGKDFATAYAGGILRMAVQAKPRAVNGLHPPHRPRGTPARKRYRVTESRLAQGVLPLGR